MTTIILNERIEHLDDLFRSLKVSVWDLRKALTRLAEEIETGESSEIGSGSRDLSQAKTLLAACQKTEMQLVELEKLRDSAGAGAPQFDLEAIRANIGSRLAGLRAGKHEECVSD